MLSTLIVALVAVTIASVLTPVVRKVATAVGAVDAPGGRRVHAAVTPRLGGAAVFVAYIGAIGVAVATNNFPWANTVHDPTQIATFLLGGLVIAVVGAIDDIRAIGAKRKLLAQVLSAAIAWYGGARIESFDIPTIGLIQLGPALGCFASIFWVVAFINAINLIDGLDGLAGGVVFFAALTNTVVAFVSGNMLAAVLNGALGGAVLGFLFYNFNPATIFLGDTGSMFLGYALGTMALLSGRQKESTLVSLLVPVIALGLPMADTIFAMLRRFLARRPIFSADRGHIHHRLLDLGLTHRRAVLILYGCTVLLCFASVAAAFGKDWQVGAALAGAVLTLVGMARFAGYFEMALLKRAQRAHLLSAPTESLRREVPKLFETSRCAESAPAVWAGLEKLLDNGHFAYAEYTPEGEAKPTWRWESSESRNGRREGKLIESEFSVRPFPGAPEAKLRFGCLSDEPDLPPQLEVLLQLATDAVEGALVRVHVRRPAQMIRPVAADSN
jgi:UDP-GlcNAc:undecaprenyl-phosphate/decaprenyl-phosphate GlcNAc-1-phosphate transferase